MGYDEFRRGPVKSLSLHLPRLRTLQIRNSATLPDAIVDPSSSDDGANLETIDLSWQIKSIHNSFADAIAKAFLSCRKSSRRIFPELELIVMGSLRYKDRRHMLSPDAHNRL
jgi:hypothetical protein